MSKKNKTIVAILSIIAVAIGVYFFEYQDSTMDFVAGCLIGIGFSGLASVLIVKTKPDLDKKRNNNKTNNS